jgi:hypothetical protein
MAAAISFMGGAGESDRDLYVSVPPAAGRQVVRGVIESSPSVGGSPVGLRGGAGWGGVWLRRHQSRAGFLGWSPATPVTYPALTGTPARRPARIGLGVEAELYQA